ncbi:protein CIAO1, putative [Entamoeba dispar SAW760]|uniref:Protein CIAO1, putative n=1 Tax=Entamoeba dispar (strain ATCC PRA-260 / SAW760) TaxID=370354 RepID=B0EEM2_ENTDS|nr:protein CIAO1, putative [Entamoeba dispar SAW760]EDR26998.1 protein CIAO1, putative [Entamoeba dispar SAW760]|eukprot:EDR26998.1 protein CIAO1, putative [Entamoeba dispar SAW760]
MQLVDSFEEENRIWSVDYSPKTNLIYTSSVAPYVHIYSFESMKLLPLKPLLTPHNRTIRRVKCSKNGLLACCSFDSTVSLWELNENTIIGTLEGHESEVKCVDWSFGSNMVATCSRDKSVWLWKSYSGIDYECCSVLTGHNGDVKTVLFHPSGTILFSGSFDGTIKVWKGEEETEWSELQTIQTYGKTVWDLKITKEGKFVVAGCANGVIILYEFKDNFLVELDTINNEKYRDIYSIDINDNNVLVGSGDNAIRLFKINTVTKKLELIKEKQEAHTNDVNCVKWINKTLSISVGDDNMLKIWKIVN